MARTRLINPAAPLDEDVARLSMAARLLWAYLPCHVDREGRMKDSAFTIKASVFPSDVVDVNALLSELADAGHVVRYQVDGRRYLQVRNFAKYQSPHKNEAPSSIPPVPLGIPRESSSNYASPRSHPVSDPVIDPDLDPGTDRDEESSEPVEPAREPKEATILAIPCVGNGPGEFAVVGSAVEAWGDAFPGVDIIGEIRKAMAWLKANSDRRKTHRGMERFLVSWFARAQDRGRGSGQNGQRATGPPRSGHSATTHAATLNFLEKHGEIP